MNLSGVLDDRFEAVGAEAFRMAPARAGFAAILALVMGFAVSWNEALAWGGTILVVEAWTWVATSRMGEPGRLPGGRVQYFWATLAGVPLWSAFGLMLWLAPGSACHLAALAYWAGQLLYAQNFGVKSPVSMAQIGAPSALAPLLIPLIFPHFHGWDQALLMTMLALCVALAFNATWLNMRAAADLAAATAATVQAKESAEAANRENVRRAADMEALAQDRLRATQEAQAAHDWLIRAVEAIDEAVAFFDEGDSLILWNHKFAGLVVSAESVLVEGAKVEAVIQAVLASRAVMPSADGKEGGGLSVEDALANRHVLLQDGRWIRIDSRELPNGGRAVLVVDITEVKVREESSRLLFDANPVAMLVFDPATRLILMANEALIAQFGHSREAIDGGKLTDFVDLPDRDTAAQPPIWLTDRGAAEAYSIRDGFGRQRQIQPYMQRTRFEGRDAIICAIMDITERREAHEALAKAKDVAEAANRSKSEFLANMSHEIRTPLNGVMGIAGALGRTKLDARQAEMVRVIEDSAESLQVLLADILDLARVEAGRLEISPEPFGLCETVVNIAELFRAKAEEKGLQLHARVAAGPDHHLLGDKVRIKQILGNLLSNAIKFTAQGSVGLTVSLEPLADGRRQVSFTVKDTGMGFDGAAQERLFSRFVQADGSITRRFGGTGLGLSISGALAEMMGGTITAESTPGEGSTFVLSLPMPVSEAPAETASVNTARRSPMGDGAPLRILAAEDHPVNRRVLQLMFEGLAVDMTMAENGFEAVERFDQEHFDLILMDMQMPVMDGLQAISEIRSRERDKGLARTPIIMLTANALPEHAAAGHAAGANAFLTKPISAQHLFETIEATLADAAQTQAA